MANSNIYYRTQQPFYQSLHVLGFISFTSFISSWVVQCWKCRDSSSSYLSALELQLMLSHSNLASSCFRFFTETFKQF